MDPEDLDDDMEENVVKELLGQFCSMGHAVKEEIIPYAVRFYTGEAGDPDDDDDDEDGESEDDDDDDDDESEDETPPAKGATKKKGKKPPAGLKKEEECKQQ